MKIKGFLIWVSSLVDRGGAKLVLGYLLPSSEYLDYKHEFLTEQGSRDMVRRVEVCVLFFFLVKTKACRALG